MASHAKTSAQSKTSKLDLVVSHASHGAPTRTASQGTLLSALPSKRSHKNTFKGTSGKKGSRSKRVPLSQHMKEWLGGRLSYMYDEVVRWAFASAAPKVAQRQLLIKRLSRDLTPSNAKEDWFDTSEKETKLNAPILAQMKQIDADLAIIKDTMSNMMGGSSFQIVLPESVPAYMIATVTSGAVQNVVSVYAGNASEWSTLAALFDEYKHVKSAVLHRNALLGPQPAGGLLNVDNTFRVSAFDPSDGAMMGSVLAGMQHGIKEVMALGVSTPTTQLPLERWEIKCPKGQLFSSGQVLLTSQDTWTSVANPVAYGYIKHYTVQTVVTAVTVESAIIEHTVDFRIRE